MYYLNYKKLKTLKRAHAQTITGKSYYHPMKYRNYRAIFVFLGRTGCLPTEVLASLVSRAFAIAAAINFKFEDLALAVDPI